MGPEQPLTPATAPADATPQSRRFSGISFNGRRRKYLAIAAVWAALAGAVVVLAGGGGRFIDRAPPPTTGFVTGSVVVEGGDIALVANAPLLVHGRTATGRRLVLNLHSNASGRFAISLPPGHYAVETHLFGNGARIRQHVYVKRGQSTAIRLAGSTFP